eukprot:g505.t1
MESSPEKSRPVFTEKSDMPGDVLRRFKAEEFSNFMLAVTAGRLSFPNFVPKAGATAVRLAKSMKPKHLASTLNAVSCSGGQSLPDLSVLLDVAMERCDSFGLGKQVFHFRPHELAATAQAAAKLCPDHPGFFKACATHLVLKLSELSVDNLTDLIEAFTNSSDPWSAHETKTEDERGRGVHDAQASGWAMYWLLQELQRRPVSRPHGHAPPRRAAASAVGAASLSTASTEREREHSEVESQDSEASEKDGISSPSRQPDLGTPWKVVSLRPPPGLEPPGSKTSSHICLADSFSYFTL